MKVRTMLRELKEENKEYVLFTHTDLDGISCEIVSSIKLGKPLKVIYTQPGKTFHRDILKYLDNDYNDKHVLLITDIAVLPETALMLKEKNINFIIIDHHKNDELVNLNYNNICIDTLVSATYILNDLCSFDSNILLDIFSLIVSRYDTFKWTDLKLQGIEKKWNDLFHFYGAEEFIDLVFNKLLNHGNLEFTLCELIILKRLEIQEEERIERYKRSIKLKQWKGFNIGVLSVEAFNSVLTDSIFKENQEIDIICNVNFNIGVVSFRGNNSKENIDVSLIAKEFGGGGHMKAASCKPDEETFRKLVNELMF